jgi:hypothetical protein
VPKEATKRRLRSDFTLGGEHAEADLLLDEAFYQSAYYHAIVSRQDSRAFIVGRTGSGKSALLQHLESSLPDHVIRINPENLSLPYITNLGVVRQLSSAGVNLDPFFIALWKHVLLVEIISHRYKITSPGAKQNFFQSLVERVKSNPSKKLALDYFNDFEGKFWCEADERIRDIIRKFESQVDNEAKASLGISHLGSIGGRLGSSDAFSTEVKSVAVERFQRIVNDTQLPRLNKMMEVLGDDILETEQNYTYVVIDDLDRDWVDETIANDLIRCLFRVVNELCRVPHLKILVALRTNIFEELDFRSRTGGQEEKLRALTLTMRWTRGELVELLDHRARAAAVRHSLDGVFAIDDLVPNPNPTRGSALDYIIDRTLMRPRDAIAYLNECFTIATGKPHLTWDVIRAAERRYSNNRLLALRDEWKSTYPAIDKVLQKFSKATAPMSRTELTRRLDDAILLMTEGAFEGTDWMERLSKSAWDPAVTDWADMYHEMFRLLFDLGFLGCRVANSDVEIYSHDEEDFAERSSNLDSAVEFYVHPAFRAALDVRESIPEKYAREFQRDYL